MLTWSVSRFGVLMQQVRERKEERERGRGRGNDAYAQSLVKNWHRSISVEIRVEICLTQTRSPVYGQRQTAGAATDRVRAGPSHDGTHSVSVCVCLSLSSPPSIHHSPLFVFVHAGNLGFVTTSNDENSSFVPNPSSQLRPSSQSNVFSRKDLAAGRCARKEGEREGGTA